MAGQLHFKFGKTFRYQATNGDLVGKGGYGNVFTGHFKSNLNSSWEEEVERRKAAIKRVEFDYVKENWLDILNDREFVALKELRHPCIVTLYAVEDDNNFRNFIFELCQANLEDFITKKYKGVLLDEIEGLYQMASGLKFIHEKKMIHRDIKPENVLISSDGQRACLKIADFGFTKPLKEDGTHYDLASGVKGTKYYMAPELLVLKNLNGRVLDNKCTIASDVFAAGCTFFRYITGGIHPFGNGFNIEVNIVAGNPINVTEDNADSWKTNFIKNMIQSFPEKRLSFSSIVERLEARRCQSSLLPAATLTREESDPSVIVVQPGKIFVGNLQFDPGNVIGRGIFGVVFAGIFNCEKVAVKQTRIICASDVNRELAIYHQLLNHSNIVQFIHIEQDDEFRYFVFELCAASLRDYIDGKYKEPMPTMPSDEQVLFQLANGLEYIHFRGILHRGINPKNILISLTKPVQIKYCGFGNSKSVNERGTCSLSGIRGTPDWLSPEEMLYGELSQEMSEKKENIRVSIKSDIFSAGCVFIFFLLRGKHPFGNDYEMVGNIMGGNPINVKELPKKHFARPFVIQMIEHHPEKRISLREVIEHLTPLQPPCQLSLLQYDNRNFLFSTGTLSLVYRISITEGSSLAVKRIPLKNCTTDSFESVLKILKQLNHSNIVHFLYFDEDDVYKYFGMELCVASLDKLFLPEGDEKKYKGPIPSDEKFCFQLISGLRYIHEKGLVHGSIKPTNILISSSEDPQIKLSDFGLTTTSRLNEGHTSKRLIGGFLSSRYWLAPELLDSNNGQNEPTKESDIFSAGSVFFYFLTKGCHLFGDENHKIIENTIKGIHENIFRKLPRTVFPSGLIRWMTSQKAGDRPKTEDILRHLIKPLPNPENLKKIGGIHYSTDHFLEGGGQGNVFIGKWENSEVAVKRIGNIDTLTEDKKELVYRERDNYLKLNHRNIVKLFAFDENVCFMILALEKCLISLHDYCCKPQLYQGIVPMPSDQEVLLQMAQGLQYIHLQGLIHRNVKPPNILISGDNPAVIKWADFGMCRAVITGSKTFSWSKLQGTDRWLAPELIAASQEEKIKGSQKCDIFALGCVFFFFLVPGIHPFGNDGNAISTQIKIRNKNPVKFDCLSEEHFAFRIIQKMIQNDPHQRAKMEDVVDALLPLSATSSIEETRSVNSGSELASNSKRERESRIAIFEESSLAVKRIPLVDCTTKSFEELKQLNHSNIVHFLNFNEDNDYKYFGMELCVASLDKLFLPEDDPNKYEGPIPSDEKFCFQLISGLRYIHEKGLVHGSIKPTNILISSSSNDPQIKLSDFGLTTTSRLNEGHTSKNLISGFLSSRYWAAPELLNNGQNEPTKESDIFAAGSVFFYFLSKGRHLFGDPIYDILANTLNGVQSNLSRNQTKSQIEYFPIIRWMTTKDPEQRSTLSEVTEQMKLFHPQPAISSIEKLKKIGRIQYSTSHLIGTGGQASVFLGLSKGSKVAVKRILIDSLENQESKSKVYRERDSFQKLKHPNVVQLIDYGENDTFMVLALEKCLTSLDYYCRKPNVCRIIPMPTDREVLLQMAQGLEYIHLQGLIHRDVKPENILISGDNPAVIKWADFGLSRTVITGSKTFSWSKLQGTDRWLAPELMEDSTSKEEKIKGSQKCDIFALGCVFFFFLVPGIHPFGNVGDAIFTQINIRNKNPVKFDCLSEGHFAFDIIKGMIENDRESRSKLPDVVKKLLNCTSTTAENTEKFLALTEVSNELGMLSQFPVQTPRKEND